MLGSALQLSPCLGLWLCCCSGSFHCHASQASRLPLLQLSQQTESQACPVLKQHWVVLLKAAEAGGLCLIGLLSWTVQNSDGSGQCQNCPQLRWLSDLLHLHACLDPYLSLCRQSHGCCSHGWKPSHAQALPSHHRSHSVRPRAESDLYRCCCLLRECEHAQSGLGGEGSGFGGDGGG